MAIVQINIMKTKLTFLLALTFLFLFSGSVYGEELEVEKRYWDNGNLMVERSHYGNEGLKTWWYRTGEKESETHYKNGEIEGLATWWYKNGRKKYSQRYKNGKLEGMKTEWYGSGKKKSTSHYKNGIANGFRKKWNKDGKLTFQGNFVDGVEEIK